MADFVVYESDDDEYDGKGYVPVVTADENNNRELAKVSAFKNFNQNRVFGTVLDQHDLHRYVGAKNFATHQYDSQMSSQGSSGLGSEVATPEQNLALESAIGSMTIESGLRDGEDSFVGEVDWNPPALTGNSDYDDEEEKGDESMDTSSSVPANTSEVWMSSAAVKTCLSDPRVRVGESEACSTDLLLSSCYMDDIFQMLRQREKAFRIPHRYMSVQPDLTHHMRSILIDWLFEVTTEFKLRRRTLFMTVSMIDRFLSKIGVNRGKLQLVGTTALFVASKFEEIYPEAVSEFAFITDDTATIEQILQLERVVLRVIDYRVEVPGIDTFTDLFAAEVGLPPERCRTVHFLSELCLLFGERFLPHLPSILAAACLAMANLLAQPGPEFTPQEIWPDELFGVTGYELADLIPCLHLLVESVHNAILVPDNSKWCRCILNRHADCVSCLALPSLNHIRAFCHRISKPCLSSN